MKPIFKPILKVALLVVVFNDTNLSAKEFSGVWASDCKSTSNTASALWISRAAPDGIYKVGYQGIKKTEPSSIIGDKEFKIINGEKIIYRNIAYHRCAKGDIPKNLPILEQQIKKYLQGEWKVKYQQRAGIINNISNGRSGLPDLTFINKDHAKISLKKQVRPVFYEVEDDNILLKTDQVNPLKVHMIDEKELRLSFEVKPESGVFIYYKYGDVK